MKSGCWHDPKVPILQYYLQRIVGAGSCSSVAEHWQLHPGSIPGDCHLIIFYYCPITLCVFALLQSDLAFLVAINCPLSLHMDRVKELLYVDPPCMWLEEKPFTSAR